MPNFAERQTGNYGFIGNHVKIINTGTVRNTVIADYATVENCTRLDNGTVNSNANAPVYIGDSVIAEDFIISSGVCGCRCRQDYPLFYRAGVPCDA